MRERDREREREIAILPAKIGDQLSCSKNPTAEGETYNMILKIHH